MISRSACTILFWGVLSATASAQGTSDAPSAEARVVGISGAEHGVLAITQTADGVSVSGNLTGVPQGEHGFHVHETGECDATTGFKSAGEHFAPRGNQHGLENPNGAHAGDMRNQSADSSGAMAVDLVNDMVSLIEGEEGYLLDQDGSALVLHSAADDYVTDPGGNSGDRIACAVIQRVED